MKIERQLQGTLNTDSTHRPVLAPEDRQAVLRHVETVWEENDSSPGWHVAEPLGPARRPIGLLSLRMSTARIYEWAREERARGYRLAAIAALMLAGGIGWLTARWVGSPLRALGEAMAGAYAGARLAPAAPELGPNEFRDLARRYNELRSALAERERESEARAALLALEERARGLERAALVDEASASFAHEIGTPLNTISGHFQLLREDLRARGVAESATRVDLVLAQVERVAGIVRAWLARGTWPQPDRHAIDLGQVGRRMLDFLEPSLSATGVTAVVDAKGGQPVTAVGDSELVEQILLNLVKNAVEAMPGGGRITLAAGIDRHIAWLTVEDDGPGMSAEAKRQLFNPFATTKGPLGTGLGLTVSRRLARALGGDLAHEPTATGTRWRLTLPAAEGAA